MRKKCGLKRSVAMVLAAGTLITAALTSVGCANTRYIMTVNGMQIPAGMYNYYAMSTYANAVSVISTQDEKFDPKNKSAVSKAVFEGQLLPEYVQDEAVKFILQYAATMDKFKELGLELDEETISDLDNYVKSYYEPNKESFTENGISKETFYDIIRSYYCGDEIFKKYYGTPSDGGINNVTEDELREHYIGINARIKYIVFNYKDAGGNVVIGDLKKSVDELAEKYRKRIADGELSFEEARSEYASVSASASSSYASSSQLASELDAATGTDESGNTIGTSSTTTPEATTTTSTDSDAVTTTTTTDPRAYEILIKKVTTGTSNDALAVTGSVIGYTTSGTTQTYTPNQAVNEAVFSQSEYNKPFIADDTNAAYLIVKLDISERMTPDDWWNEDVIENMRSDKYYKTFLDMLKDWADAIEYKTNDASLNRYKPWKFALPDNNNNLLQ